MSAETQKKDNEKSGELLDRELMLDTASFSKTKGRYPIHCLVVAGQVEGHTELPDDTKATKYEHVIPLLVAAQEYEHIKGLLIILNTVGGDVEAGLAIAELIAGIDKPTVSLVLGGGHSIGIPLAVAADRSFIVPTATMTVHPVRHNGTVIGVPQTMRRFESMQQRIVSFICAHSNVTPAAFRKLLSNTGQLVMDVGTVLDGSQAVEQGIIDELGSLSDALAWLHAEIDRQSAQDKGERSSHAPQRRGKKQQSAKGT